MLIKGSSLKMQNHQINKNKTLQKNIENNIVVQLSELKFYFRVR